jgi:uncharacterized protein
MKLKLHNLLAVVMAVAVSSPVRAADASTNDCRVGAYRLTDGSFVDVGPSTGGMLRWRRFDGSIGALHPHADGTWTSTAGWSDHGDGKTASFSPCPTGDMVFESIAGHRIAFDVTETTFNSDGVKLAGRLVLPIGGGPVPIVVLVHGSEKFSARNFYSLQRLLPAEDVGVFVYDKRGSGDSAGEYTQNFNVLARDAAAALREARRLAGARTGRIGFEGGSQGGYVAPLAASLTQADFIVIGFGLAVSPLEEDREEVELEMRLKGHADADIAKALQVADAAGVIVNSGLTRGFDTFDALRAKYRGEAWYKDLHGNFTGDLLPYSEAELHARSKDLLVGTPMAYDPMPLLQRLRTPQLWILGSDDLAAPSAETARRLKGLGTQGLPVTLAMFPRAEHGVYEYETLPDGTRVDLRNPDGYLSMIRDYARDGALHGSYGAGVVTKPRVAE